MQTISALLIIIGFAIIAAVLLLRWRLRQRPSSLPRAPMSETPLRAEPDDFDPLFAIDRARDPRDDLNELPAVRAEPDGPVAPAATPPRSAVEAGAPPTRSREPTPVAPPEAQPVPSRAAVPPPRGAPRVAADPERVIAMNVVAPEGRRFTGDAVAAAAHRAGLELGAWSIYHCYSPHAPEAPPLFSMANMMKPGSFDAERMHELSTVGLSLFMVPANDEHDLTAFDAMLATVRRLASELGGEVRDARRSVLTRQAIERLREQLNEGRVRSRMKDALSSRL